MFSFLRRLKNLSAKRYTLKISDLVIRNNILFCRIYDIASENPYDVAVSELLANDSVLSQISPRELLKLKEKYDRFAQEYVTVMETHRNNKYRLSYAEQEFLMEGKDICKDLNLLKAMKIEDAFRIIYETSFCDAMQLSQQLVELDQQVALNVTEKKDNVLFFKPEQ